VAAGGTFAGNGKYKLLKLGFQWDEWDVTTYSYLLSPLLASFSYFICFMAGIGAKQEYVLREPSLIAIDFHYPNLLFHLSSVIT